MRAALTPDILVNGFTPATDPQLAPDGTAILHTRLRVPRGEAASPPATAPPTSRERGHARAGSVVGGTHADLWLCDAEGGSARRLTSAGRRNEGGRWSPDGRSVAFLSDRGGDGTGIYVLPVDGGEPREVVRHRLHPPSEPAWSPDGGRVAYVATVDPANPHEVPPPADGPPPVRVVRRFDYKEDGRGLLLDARLQVHVVDVETGARTPLTSRPADHFAPAWSPDGRTIATLVRGGHDWSTELVLVDAGTGAERRRVGPPGEHVELASWAPAGDRLLLTAARDRRPHPDVWVAAADGGALTRLTEDTPWLVVSPPAWLDGRRALLHVHHRGASALLALDVETGELDELVRFRSLNDGLSVDRAGRLAVQAHESPDAAGELAVVALDSGAARVVTRLSEPVLRAAPPAACEALEVQRDGVTIDAWLLLPPGFDPSRRHPLVLDVHGGPHMYYGYGFDLAQQALAAQGFLVAYANPRGSASYGNAHAEAVNGEWGGDDYRDLLAVVDAVAARPYADPDRVGITGYSYGGYMTAWAIGQSDRFRAAVCGAPVFNLVSQYGTSDISPELHDLEWGGAPHERADLYAARSPSTFAHRATTPTLILAAEDDLRCPVGQAEEMYVALARAGCEVELVRYAGGGHGWFHAREGRPEHRVDVLERTVAWFERHLGGTA